MIKKYLPWGIGVFLALVIALVFVAKSYFQPRYNPIVDTAHLSDVIYYDKSRAYKGYNIRNQANSRTECTIVDMEGREIRDFPGGFCQFYTAKKVVFSTVGDDICMWDIKGNILWKRHEVVHHDTFLDQSTGELFAITWEKQMYQGKLTHFAAIVAYNLKGERVYRWASYDHLKDIYKHIDKAGQQVNYDPGMKLVIGIKINSVSVIRDHPLRDTNPVFKDGNLLVSFRREGILAVLDRVSGKIVWSYKLQPPQLQSYLYVGAHTARVTKDGDFIFFMTHFKQTTKHPSGWYSAVVKLDPVSKTPSWIYTSNPQEIFSSNQGGAVTELPNGNILVTVEHLAMAFEVTRDKRVVWEYVNPQNSGAFSPMFRMERLPAERLAPFLENDPI